MYLRNCQVLIGWAIRRGTTVIPKTVSPARLEENLKGLEVAERLTEEDMVRLGTLDTHDGSGRLNKGGSFLQEGQTWQSMWEEDWTE